MLTNSERAQRFLADVVGAWAEARGLSSVAMNRTYSRVATGARAAVGIAGLASVGLAWRLGRDLRSGARRFAPFARESVRLRAVLGSVGVLTAGLWWGFARDILRALVPVLSGWLTVSLTVFAVIAVLFALVPRTDDR